MLVYQDPSSEKPFFVKKRAKLKDGQFIKEM
jgi:hypothetical protein